MKKKLLDYKFTIVGFVLTTVIVVYMLSYVVSPLSEWHFLTDIYNYAEYDITLNRCTQTYLDEILFKNTEVESYVIFDISLLEHTLKSDSATIETFVIESVKADSLEAVKDLWLPDILINTYDEQLIKQKNAILLPQGYATDLSVTVGDEVYVEDQLYILAGIYQQNNRLIEGIVLSDDTDVVYNYVHVKFKDPEKGIEYIEKNYFDQHYLYYKYGENYMDYLAPGNMKYSNYLYETREGKLEFQSYMYKSNKISAIAHVVIAFAMFFTIQIYVNHKNFERKMKFYAIRISCGYQKRKLIFKRFLWALFEDVLIFISAMLIYTYVFGFMGKSTLYDLYFKFIIAIVAAAMVLALLSQFELRKNNLLRVLKTEE